MQQWYTNTITAQQLALAVSGDSTITALTCYLLHVPVLRFPSRPVPSGPYHHLLLASSQSNVQ
jgi:hypothetical protein